LDLYYTDPFWKAATRGAQAAARASGAAFTQVDANLSATTQADQFLSAETSGANVIELAPVDVKAAVAQVVKARKMGIKVCGLALGVPNTYVDATVELNEYGNGQFAAQYILQQAKKEGLKSINVMQITVSLTTEAGIERTGGFDSIMKNPNSYGIHVNVVSKSALTPEDAATAFEDAATTTKFQALFNQTDVFAPGLIPILKRDGYTPRGGKNHVIWIGTGGIPTGLAAIRQGWQDASINFPIDKIGGVCTRLMVALRNGQSVRSSIACILKEEGLPAATTKVTYPPTGPIILPSPALITPANVNSQQWWGNQKAAA
jgi:ABC-type sugar transport system substrate-binding protein